MVKSRLAAIRPSTSDEKHFPCLLGGLSLSLQLHPSRRYKKREKLASKFAPFIKYQIWIKKERKKEKSIEACRRPRFLLCSAAIAQRPKNHYLINGCMAEPLIQKRRRTNVRVRTERRRRRRRRRSSWGFDAIRRTIRYWERERERERKTPSNW